MENFRKSQFEFHKLKNNHYSIFVSYTSSVTGVCVSKVLPITDVVKNVLNERKPTQNAMFALKRRLSIGIVNPKNYFSLQDMQEDSRTIGVKRKPFMREWNNEPR